MISVPEGLPAELTQRRAGAFVSIHKHGQLRGCIGTIAPTRESLAEEIIHNAISARAMYKKGNTRSLDLGNEQKLTVMQMLRDD